jgi:hypothetical protein
MTILAKLDHYDRFETTGSRADELGGATLVQNGTIPTATGIKGNGADLEASSSHFFHVVDTTKLRPGSQSFFLFGWISFESLGAIRDLWSKWLPTGNQLEYRLLFNNTNTRLQWIVSANGSASTTVTADNFGPPSTGTLYFIYVYYNHSTGKIGIKVNNGTANEADHTGVFQGTGRFMVGNRDGGTTYHDGLIDELGVGIGDLLTDAEQTWLYAAGVGRSFADIQDYSTAPALTSPTGSSSSMGATTDEGDGTLYGVITTSNTQPTATQIQAGQSHLGAAATFSGSVAVPGTGARTISVSGLTTGTYYAHLVQVGAIGDTSNIVTSSSFSVDTTAPVLSSPTGSESSIGATTNESGGILHGVVTTSATPPSAAQIVDQEDHLGNAAAFADNVPVSGTGVKTIPVSGLTPGTYYAHLVQKDAANNTSNVVSSSSFVVAEPSTSSRASIWSAALRLILGG